MTLRTTTLALALACLATVGAQESPKTDSITIRAFTQSWNQNLEIQPTLESDGIVSAPLGCLDNTQSDCPPHLAVSGITRSAVMGTRLAVRVEGKGNAEAVRVVVNGNEVAVKEGVALPLAFQDIELPDAGVVHVFATTEAGVYDMTFPIDEPGASKSQHRSATTIVSSSIFRFITEVAEEGNWEVLTGSGTGGRLVTTSRRCFEPALPLQFCPIQWIYFGYTDRAKRGEVVRTRVEFSGQASQLGVIINGRVRGQWSNVPLPVIVPQTVSLSPTDDNIYVFAIINGKYVERRLPVGTRPF